MFSGYVLVEMIVTMIPGTWSATRRMSPASLLRHYSYPDRSSRSRWPGKTNVRFEPQHQINFEINELVRITDGPFKNFEGKVSNVDQERGKVKVLITMFGRETPVELDAMRVKSVALI